MFNSRNLKRTSAVTLLLILFVSLSAFVTKSLINPSERAMPAAVQLAMVSAQTDVDIFEVDMAENGLAWIYDKNGPVHDDGMPDYGNSFVTEGYLYPAGTIIADNGVLADGSPEFPDKVIGKWTCRGWNVGRGMHTETGPMAVTTQIFEFYDRDGTIIVTDGYEISDFDVPVLRAIMGGTRDHVGVRGESSQTWIGVNSTEGFNARFSFTVAKDLATEQ